MSLTSLHDSLVEHVLRLRPHLTRDMLANVRSETLLKVISQHRDGRRRYQAKTTIAGKRVSLGYFKTPEEARLAVETAKFAHSIGLPYNAR